MELGELSEPRHTSRSRLNRFEAGFKPPPGSGLQTGSQAGY